MRHTKNNKNLYMPVPIFSKATFTFIVFFITYSTFTSLHASRSAWSYSKKSLEMDPNYGDSINDHFLGIADMIFMLFYGCGLFISGYIGDKFSLKKMLVLGMSLCTFFYSLIFITRAAHDSNAQAIIAFMCFNGLFQSTGFPACVTILGNWINKKTKGRVYGLWSSCHNIGNIVGLIFGMIANDNTEIGWQYSILFAALFMGINTILIGVFVVSTPLMAGFQEELPSAIKQKNNQTEKINAANEEKIEKNKEEFTENEEKEEKPHSEDALKGNSDLKALSLNNDQNVAILVNDSLPIQKSLNPFRVCLIPGVFFYAILNTFIKTVVITLLFWLPYYLKQQKLDHHAANIAVLFEFGQIIGGFVLGYLCDKLHRRASLITPALLVNVILFIIVSNLGSKEDLPGYYISLFLIGILLGGPANLIAAMTSHDIAHNPENKKKNKKIAASLVGIIDGSAYIGVAITQTLIPYLVSELFLFMIVFLCCSCAWISPMAIREVVSFKAPAKEEINSVEMESQKDHKN